MILLDLSGCPPNTPAEPQGEEETQDVKVNRIDEKDGLSQHRVMPSNQTWWVAEADIQRSKNFERAF